MITVNAQKIIISVTLFHFADESSELDPTNPIWRF